ncbi:MAG TPA: amidohydrolase family protein [Xanthomonadales bacterium]|nr:amidohydrolase family protein [Xanthomonadales bacterium]
MNTRKPNTDELRLDIHCHVLPENWPDFNTKFGVSGFPVIGKEDGRTIIRRNGQFFREVWSNIYEIHLRMAQFAEYGISVQVISTVPVMFSYDQEPQHALAMSQFLNDHVASLQAEHPRRVIALGTIPMQDADTAIAEMRRLKEELNVPGVQIGSNVNQKNLGEAEFFPIFEAAQDLGLAIMVHPWQMMGQAEMQKYWLPWLVGMPAEISRAICSMIFSGVLEKLPALRVCFAHGGGAFPFTIGRIEHGFNMRPDLVAVDNPVNPRSYFKQFWVDSITHDPQALRYLLDVAGEDRVIFGTDYPFPLGEQEPGGIAAQLNLSAASEKALFAQNALNWLNLHESDFR